jgi:hypothetical protein
MRKIVPVFIACVVFMSAICTKVIAQFQPVAVIELFSSQGCSSCPPADKLLSKTIANAEKDGRKIFALEFHVDYWNRLGWSDPFSDKKYTDRQDQYAAVLGLSSVYTPQMIVNGSREFVGSNEAALKDALTQALQTKSTAAFKTLTATVADGKPQVQYSLEGDFAGCKVNVALISLSETTPIKRGENGGRTLVNEHVVRQFISEQAKASGEIDFASSPLPAKSNMAVIAYIQRTADSKIIGAAQVEIR